MFTTYSFTLTVLVIVLLVLLIRSIRTGIELRELLDGCTKAQRHNQDIIESNTKTIRSLERQLQRAKDYTDLDLKEANDKCVILREDLKESRKLLREAANKLTDYLLSDITSIKFTANIPTKGWTKTEFKLGVGSCGKEVTALHWTEKADRYELRQTCSDGERKEFTYFKEDIAGRIEMTYAAIKPTL